MHAYHPPLKKVLDTVWADDHAQIGEKGHLELLRIEIIGMIVGTVRPAISDVYRGIPRLDWIPLYIIFFFYLAR